MRKILTFVTIIISFLASYQTDARRVKVYLPDEILARIQQEHLTEEFLASSLQDVIRISEGSSPLNNSNCMGYVMGIDREMRPEEFYSSLAGYEEISSSDAQPGDIVLYTKSGYPLHAGIYIGNGWVRSKWDNGPVFEHELDFVFLEWKTGGIKFYRVEIEKFFKY